MQEFELRNGVKIPCIGFGTWQIPDDRTVQESVEIAISAGYRHIDTAAFYQNECGIGKAIKASKVSRKELFVTSKVWNDDRGYKKTIVAFEKTLNALQTDYLDLYLIHWPASPSRFSDWERINLETWQAMTELYKSGRIRAIGVSNFMPHHLSALMRTEVKPMVNQIEFHPGVLQAETVSYCKENGIVVEAWSPLGSGKILHDLTLKRIAAKYGKSVAGLCIRWALQHDVLPLPKSVTPSRICENLKIFDFLISEDDMREIDSMPNIGGEVLHPDRVSF